MLDLPFVLKRNVNQPLFGPYLWAQALKYKV